MEQAGLWQLLFRCLRLFLRLVGITSPTDKAPLVAVGLPPFNQQAETAQELRLPVVVEVKKEKPRVQPAPAPSQTLDPDPDPDPNQLPDPNEP